MPPGPPVLELRGVPANPNLLWSSRDEAVSARRADIVLSFCERCGLIWNSEFDPDALDYTADYDNSLHFSPTFQRYAEELADRLIERYDVHGKTVVEIGCGKGEFLSLLCARGGNRGLGFDPSYNGESDDEGDVQFVRELYAEETASADADLIAFRHVLEHVAEPLAFLRTLRRAIGERETVVYCEVPAAEYLLRERAVWDVIYPHVSVFATVSLRHLFERTGFTVLDTGFGFAEQYLWIEAKAREGPAEAEPPAGVGELRPLAAAFGEAVRERQRHWADAFAALNGDSVAVWGAGAKATTFLNIVPGSEHVAAAVDVNPRKHGKFIPGSGQRIVSPEAVAGRAPAQVVLMNPVYHQEVEKRLRELGLHAEVVTV